MASYLSDDILKKLRGRLTHNDPLYRYCLWRVGGPADHVYQPADVEDLALFLSAIPVDEPIYWLGLGSKMLVRDQGFRGTIILIAGTLQNISFSENTEILYAEAGLPSARLAYFSVGLGYTGLEFLAGIPGAVGGALTMNAGAFGSQTWTGIVQAKTIDRQGHIHIRNADEFQIQYREVHGPVANEGFIGAYFHLKKGDRGESLKHIQTMLERRRSAHPLHIPNVGSIFRNPSSQHAAQLIESCGLKGYRIGGACVSNLHANFIINDANATATDIEQLMTLITETVKAKTGITLIKEVKILEN